jgi:hypothetical protein
MLSRNEDGLYQVATGVTILVGVREHFVKIC